MHERILELVRLLRCLRLQFAAIVRVVAGDESLPASEQSQLGIWIETPMSNPPAQKQIFPRKFVTARSIRTNDGNADFLGQSPTHLLVGVEQQHPVLSAQLDRVLLLRHVAAPWFNH